MNCSSPSRKLWLALVVACVAGASAPARADAAFQCSVFEDDTVGGAPFFNRRSGVETEGDLKGRETVRGKSGDGRISFLAIAAGDGSLGLEIFDLAIGTRTRTRGKLVGEGVSLQVLLGRDERGQTRAYLVTCAAGSVNPGSVNGD